MTPNVGLEQTYREDNCLVAVLRDTMTGAEEERVIDHIVVDHGGLSEEGLYPCILIASELTPPNLLTAAARD